MNENVTPPYPFMAGKHCLVLEDEFLIALDIQQVLESAGAIVSGFSSAEAALAALNGGTKFNVAILDIRLGADGNGLSVAAAVAAKRIPFVFLTGMHAGSFDLRDFPQALVVEKPYQLDALMEALRTAISSNDEQSKFDRLD